MSLWILSHTLRVFCLCEKTVISRRVSLTCYIARATTIVWNCLGYHAVRGVKKRRAPLKNRYILKSNYSWKIIHMSFEIILLKMCDGVPLFIDTCEHLVPKNNDVEKLVSFWPLHSTLWISSHAIKGSMLSLVRLPSTSILVKRLSRKQCLHQKPPLSWAPISGTKGS